MKKVYFIYVAIPEEIFNTIKYILDKSDNYRWKKSKMFGLYAWSTNKSIVKEFFQVRNKDIYTIVKKEIDDFEYKNFKDIYNTLKLDRRLYYFDRSEKKERSIEIVSTKNEYIASTMNAEENLWEFGPPIEQSVPYTIFNNDIIYALDYLGYTKEYDLRYAAEDTIDFNSYNESFGLTPLGNRNKMIYENQMNILLYLFRFFFYGDKKCEVT